MAMYFLQLAVLVLRGPHCPENRWFGYEGGLKFWRTSPSNQPHAVVNVDVEKAECDPLPAVYREVRDAEEKNTKEIR
jgi:hypothetical protein